MYSFRSARCKFLSRSERSTLVGAQPANIIPPATPTTNTRQSVGRGSRFATASRIGQLDHLEQRLRTAEPQPIVELHGPIILSRDFEIDSRQPNLLKAGQGC